MKKAVVVGAGAGGVACAVQLAQSGQFQVELLEAGGDFSRFSLDMKMLEPMRKAGLFLDARMISILFGDMRVAKSADMVHVWGRGVGGTTNLATGNGVRYDKDLAAIGVDLDQEFEEVYQVVPISTDHRKRWSDETVQAFEACEELGFAPVVTPKLTHPGKCCNCGKCVFGCPVGAKWTSTELLELAPEGTLSVRKNCAVKRLVLGAEGRATGVELKNGKTVAADVVVVAAGGINTPRVLEASGFPCKPTFYGDPVLCVATEMKGVKQDTSLPMPFVAQRDGYILSPYFDQLSFFFDKGWRRPSQDIFSLMIKFEDDMEGRITQRGIEKALTDHDYQTMARAVDDCYAIFQKMGVAKEDTFLGLVNEGHPGGTYPFSEAEAETLHHETLPENVYLADSSLFNKSMGNPPILTIMALAKKVAKAICAADRAEA